jgi:hypothetical protein
MFSFDSCYAALWYHDSNENLMAPTFSSPRRLAGLREEKEEGESLSLG